VIGRAFRIFCPVLAATSCVPSESITQDFVTKRIGDDVLIVTARFTWWDVNMAALSTREGLVLVDTLYHPDAAREARKLIKRFSDQPVRFVINTHQHADHTFGNGEFREALIIGHSRCPAGMESEMARQLESCRICESRDF
jgi:glyoxylase-like metal-dependent hydrolase (beta-lactamase superfamily II)